MAKYNQYTPEFKMKVALEAASGLKGINEIAGQYGVHTKQVTEWKKRLTSSAETIFEKRVKEEDQVYKREEELLKKVGQLSMEIEWFKKKLEKQQM